MTTGWLNNNFKKGQISILRYMIGVFVVGRKYVIGRHKSMKKSTLGPEKSDVIGNSTL